MPADFTVIIQVRQRFGDEPDFLELQIETESPFVGASKEFTFDIPGVDRSQNAILQFQSLGVSHRMNILKINDVGIFGGISRSIDLTPPELRSEFIHIISRPRWTTHSLIIQPNLLKNENNTLFIGARNADGEDNGNLDNFIIDNMIVLYKIRTGITAPIHEGFSHT